MVWWSDPDHEIAARRCGRSPTRLIIVLSPFALRPNSSPQHPAEGPPSDPPAALWHRKSTGQVAGHARHHLADVHRSNDLVEPHPRLKEPVHRLAIIQRCGDGRWSHFQNFMPEVCFVWITTSDVVMHIVLEAHENDLPTRAKGDCCQNWVSARA